LMQCHVGLNFVRQKKWATVTASPLWS
jgi:hypothetical protein